MLRSVDCFWDDDDCGVRRRQRRKRVFDNSDMDGVVLQCDFETIRKPVLDICLVMFMWCEMHVMRLVGEGLKPELLWGSSVISLGMAMFMGCDIHVIGQWQSVRALLALNVLTSRQHDAEV